MTTSAEDAALEARALGVMKVALGLVSIVLPHLAELIAVVRIHADPRVETAAITRSGYLLIHPRWFGDLGPHDAAFVAAHELMHLALRSHDRDDGASFEITNWAHDYIINDMLSEAFGCAVPAGGLELPGARHMSLEELAKKIRDAIARGESLRSWSSGGALPTTALGAALRKAGRAAPLAPRLLDALGRDMLDERDEHTLFPDEPEARRRAAEQRVLEASTRAASLEALTVGIESAFGGRGDHPGAHELTIQAIETAYRPPWQDALQTWMESIAPGPRTYARASRRGADRTDVVLAGRRREGFTLHIVLDTSGSMATEFPRIAGMIRSFCDSVGVSDVHLLQCDVDVSCDELLDVDAFANLTISGLGGSDLSPALRRLGDDPEVLAAVVLTDGYIDYPEEQMPYEILWVLTTPALAFNPPYGRVLPLAP